MSSRRVRSEQVEQTRDTMLRTAERLFAEHGVASVSNRQISEASGQGNNAAVNYHFGTKSDLVREIVRRHAGPMEEIRRGLLERYSGSTELRDWVTCVVRSITDHLDALGHPSWYARFAAQLITEPALRELAAAEIAEAPMFLAVLDALHACLPDLPPEVRHERDDMAHTLILHFCAQRERSGTPRWSATAAALIDAVDGLYRAPSRQSVA
ncbi:TetR family transcriptional regulator [Actinoplanes ianthinogenes]|uniref:TetR family transcriptional regulator n=1 Tax=Actinoplanes ianthinogenes TaxID=122358 RepID=A0ABM7LJU5_9ACTN|nr:TetR family transcriptional regulator [Actinoplanes ianthinogenes]BCJ39540.1 TetR family transcriptional regulator [Actinoplanes ianthinogenes]GGR35406.1 TetR family transcriptional regulator [Actinoplanes ianthinogenes]